MQRGGRTASSLSLKRRGEPKRVPLASEVCQCEARMDENTTFALRSRNQFARQGRVAIGEVGAAAGEPGIPGCCGA